MTHYAQWLPLTSNRLSNFDRVRVDAAQTGFFEGREFRSVKELSIAASATYVIKVTVPVKTILSAVKVDLDAGYLRIGTYAGGTEGGSFAETIAIFGVNNMPAGPDHRSDFPGVYVRQNTLMAGGTHTGGTELDVIRVKTAANAQQGGSQSVTPDLPRGIAPGTYYFRLLNLSATDTVLGTFKLHWEERP